jgi:hypothetical protein
MLARLLLYFGGSVGSRCLASVRLCCTDDPRHEWRTFLTGERLHVALERVGFHASHDTRDALLNGTGKRLKIRFGVRSEITGPTHVSRPTRVACSPALPVGGRAVPFCFCGGERVEG